MLFRSYGNTAEGFESLNGRISGAAESAGRDPRDIGRSACVLVELDSNAVKRPHTDADVPPLAGGNEPVAAALRELGEAGADEAILVLRPITERSIRELGGALALLGG